MQPTTRGGRGTMVASETLADYVVRLCRRRGWSWRVASIEAGLNPHYISHLVRGQVNPKAETLFALAQALDGDYDYMLRLRDLAPVSAEEERSVLERRLTDEIMRLSPEDRERMIAMIEGLVGLRNRQQE